MTIRQTVSCGAAFGIAGLALSAVPASAEEGMWTFDAFPTAKVRKDLGWAPDKAWLDTVRASAVRLTGGCSASVVSPQGLVLTNHHCVIACVQDLSTDKTDYVQAGFTARSPEDERKCPGQQAEIVTAITDVTPQVKAAIGNATGEALVRAEIAAIARIESGNCTDGATQRCQVIKLYGGGQYKLYRYRKYSDVRLVFAPEFKAAFFGGDPDNFNFPRYALDVGFLRLYENGRPIAAESHLRWNPAAPKEGDATFVVGNPGSTQRLFTQDQFALRRDVIFPLTVPLMSEYRGRLIAAMTGDKERTRTGADTLFGIENSYKVYVGQWQALRDPGFSSTLAANEAKLRAAVAKDAKLRGRIGDPWANVARADAAYRDFYADFYLLEANAGYGSTLYGYAEALVRAATEREKPDAQRLPGYSSSRLALLEKELTDEKPVYPWLEKLTLSFWLSKTREILTVDNADVKRMLGKESPEALAERLVGGSRLADPKVRKRLFDGGMAAIRASDDPLIRFFLINDERGRALSRRYDREVGGQITAAQAKLATARFAVHGDSIYPDATFSLRISYGRVKGWTYRGTTVPPFTYIGGLYDRATGAEPFEAAPKWLAAQGRIAKDTVYDYVTTNDIIGGNSGSPVIARDGSVIGAAFDGNIHSIGGSYGYDAALNRTVVVSSAAITEALKTVYDAGSLLKELSGG
ncbi:MAG: S46 family peptidase [Sphingobium sp.]